MQTQKLSFGPPSLSWEERLKRYSNQHWQAYLWSLRKLTRMPFASFIALLIIGIALALPVGLTSLLQNMQHITKQWYEQETLSLYLHQNINSLQAKQVIKRALTGPLISHTQYISPQEGLSQFKEYTRLNTNLASLGENPLPGVIIVWPKQSLSVPELESLHQRLIRIPEVESVQFDMAWVKQLHALVHFSEEILYLLAAFLGIGIILITSNTVRLSVQGHEMEMTVLALMGATHGYIRRPFLYTGAIMGFIGGFVAWILISFMAAWLSEPINMLISAYNVTFIPQGMSNGLIALLLIGSGLLGLIGAAIGASQPSRVETLLHKTTNGSAQ